MTDENPASSPLQHPNPAKGSRSSRGCRRQSGAPRSCRSPALLQGDSPRAPGGPSSRRHEQTFLPVLLQTPFVWVPEDLPGCHLHPSSLQAAPRAEGAAYLCLPVLDPIFPSRAQLRVLRLLQPSQPCARLPAPPALLQSILSLSPPCPCLTQGCVIPTLVSSRRHNSSY